MMLGVAATLKGNNPRYSIEHMWHWTTMMNVYPRFFIFGIFFSLFFLTMPMETEE